MIGFKVRKIYKKQMKEDVKMSIAEQLMEHVEPALEMVLLVLNILSVLILLWGIITVLRHYLTSRYSKGERQSTITAIRQAKIELGAYILLSLELLIITDVIESTMSPTIEGLVRLLLVVLIRTLMSFFLNKEIHEDEEKTEKEEHKIHPES